MSETDPYPWTRRDGESGPAYEGFKTYLELGPNRSIVKVADALGKARQTIEGWSSRHGWVERVRAYDRYTETAASDGLIHMITETRDDTLALARKLCKHLDSQLDGFMRYQQDPSIRWSTAVNALCKLQGTAFAMKNDPKTEAQQERVMELVAKITGVDVEQLMGRVK